MTSNKHMAGINNLHDLYKRKGKEFIERLVSLPVTVDEDLSASAFAFEKQPDGSFRFFKRNGAVEITRIDRVLMRYYEDAINYVTSFDQKNPNIIPVKYRFCTQYFVSKQPVRISYDRMPRNQMVLTHIQVKNELGETKRLITKVKKLNEWADRLEIEKPPIIFQGNLSDTQKGRILDFVYTPTDRLAKKYGTRSFAKHIISVLRPDLRKTLLQDTIDKDIEGVVFRFGEGQESVVAKIVDQQGIEMSSQIPVDDTGKRPSDMFFLTLLDINDFMQTLPYDQEKQRFTKIRLSAGTYEERYVEFVCQVFNLFIADRGFRYHGADFDAPAYTKTAGGNKFDVNMDLIQNEDTREFIEADVAHVDLFKIFLNAFRKRRKKEASFFTKDVLTHFNDMVDKIQRFVGDKAKEPKKVNESTGFMGVIEFMREYHAYDESDYLVEADEDEDDDTETDDEETDDTGLDLDVDSDESDDGDSDSDADSDESDAPDDEEGDGGDDSGEGDDGGESDSDDSDDGEDGEGAEGDSEGDSGDSGSDAADSDEPESSGSEGEGLDLDIGDDDDEKSGSEDDDDEEEEEEELADDDDDEDDQPGPDPMRVTTFLNKVFRVTDEVDVPDLGLSEAIKQPGVPTGPQPVCLVVGNFQPFDAGDFQNIKEIYEAQGLPVVIIDVNTGVRNSKFPISQKLMGAMMMRLIQEHSKMIVGFKQMGRALLTDLLHECKDTYKVTSIACAGTLVTSYQKQLDYATTYGSLRKVEEPIEIVALKDLVETKSVHAALIENDFVSYRALMPRCFAEFFDHLRTEVAEMEGPVEIDKTTGWNKPLEPQP